MGYCRPGSEETAVITFQPFHLWSPCLIQTWTVWVSHPPPVHSSPLGTYTGRRKSARATNHRTAFPEFPKVRPIIMRHRTLPTAHITRDSPGPHLASLNFPTAWPSIARFWRHSQSGAGCLLMPSAGAEAQCAGRFSKTSRQDQDIGRQGAHPRSRRLPERPRLVQKR